MFKTESISSSTGYEIPYWDSSKSEMGNNCDWGFDEQKYNEFNLTTSQKDSDTADVDKFSAKLYFVEPKVEGYQAVSTPAQDTDCIAELYYDHKQEHVKCQSSIATDVNNSVITNPGVVPSEISGASCDNSNRGNEDITLDNTLFRCEHSSFTTVHRAI